MSRERIEAWLVAAESDTAEDYAAFAASDHPELGFNDGLPVLRALREAVAALDQIDASATIESRHQQNIAVGALGRMADLLEGKP